MLTHLDHPAPVTAAPTEPLPHAPDDTATYDLSDLWQDTGGSG